MNIDVHNVFKNLFSVAAMAAALSQPAAAAWVGGDNTLELGTAISNPSFNGSTVGFTGNAALNNNAWGHQGGFTNFYLPISALSVTVEAKSGTLNHPAFSIYRTNVAWEGQTVGNTSLPAPGVVTNFNQVGQAGDPGIIWATGANGIVETLGYVSSSSKNYVNAFGGVINSGAHDISATNQYENGITGSVTTSGNPAFATSKRIAQLTLNDLQAGWYTLFVGGADALGTSGDISLKVTASGIASTYAPAPAAVPVPAAVWLFGSALAGFVGVSRRKPQA